MRQWLQSLFGRKAQPAPATDDRILDLQRDLQTLKLELEEKEHLLQTLHHDLERQRRTEGDNVSTTVQAQLEKLMTAAAGPVAQLLTQAHLLEAEDKPVQAKDVLTVARRLISTLEDEGLALSGVVGEKTTFDPNFHQPLRSNAEIQPGEPVVIRLTGVSFRGTVLRKASVDQEEA